MECTRRRALRERLEASNGFVICSPEYNASMPGVLKNAIDWVSRCSSSAIQRAPRAPAVGVAVDGGRKPWLWTLRVPFLHLGARIHPDMFSLAQAHHVFDDGGEIVDERLRARFDDTIADFLDLVEAATHYPCVKRAWVEFLGESPDPHVDRVEP